MRTTITTALAILLILAQFRTLLGEEAGNPSEKVRLQQALFAEEAERDLPKAAREYELLVEEYTVARRIGLSALYRLAEVRRKQKRNDDAAKLYLRIVSEFPDDPEARLSRENLTAMGVGLPAAPNRIPDDPDETKELRRLMMLAKNSPERMWDEVPLALNNIGNQTTSPLSKAARRGWLRVVAFLAEEHKKSGRNQRELDLALYSAARSGQVDSCRLLVKLGATLEIAQRALVEAIQSNHQAVGDWLLKEGVDVNTVGQGRLENLENRRYTQRGVYSGEEQTKLSSTSVSLTPLGAAIAADDPAWIDRLLKLGADVNHETTENWTVDISPLSIACWKGHAPLVTRLLDLGADPNDPDKISSFAKEIRQPASTAKGWRPLHYAAGKPEIVALLLAAGADAQGADAERFTPLHTAAYLNAAKSCEALLKGGALSDPAAKLSWLGDKQWTPIMLAAAHANQEDGGAAAKEVIKMLIKGGADSTPEGLAPRDRVDLCPVTKLRVWLAELVQYPEIARSKGITVALPAASASHLLVDYPADGTAPPSLAAALLAWVEPMNIMGDQTYTMERSNVRRADESGQFQKIPFEVTDPDSHPELRWGDIIEFLPAEMDAPAYVVPWISKAGRTNNRGVTSVALEPEVYLELFAQMELKITIAWPARPRQEITLRGGLRVYDPGRAEAPLVSPRALVELLGGSARQTLRITRSQEHGGGMIDLPKKNESAEGIRFFDGDVLTVGPLDPEEAKRFRAETFQVLEPESGYPWAQWPAHEAKAFPSLLQFLTAFYLPLETFELESMSEVFSKEKDFKKWDPDEIARAVRLSGVAPWATISHPDMREIWIDRLDGERIRIPLAELIAKTNADTPDEFYRKADLQLQPGDIVELRLLDHHGEEPWIGFDPEVLEFMKKALTYDIVRDGILQRVQWTPPHWFETPVGPIAVGRTVDKPLVMDVDQFGRSWVSENFKRDRMGGSTPLADRASHPQWERHSGLDERGLLKSLRPRLIRLGTPAPSFQSNRKRFVPRPGK
jgi:ankyrin repeat protein